MYVSFAPALGAGAARMALGICVKPARRTSSSTQTTPPDPGSACGMDQPPAVLTAARGGPEADPCLRDRRSVAPDGLLAVFSFVLGRCASNTTSLVSSRSEVADPVGLDEPED